MALFFPSWSARDWRGVCRKNKLLSSPSRTRRKSRAWSQVPGVVTLDTMNVFSVSHPRGTTAQCSSFWLSILTLLAPAGINGRLTLPSPTTLARSSSSECSTTRRTTTSVQEDIPVSPFPSPQVTAASADVGELKNAALGNGSDISKLLQTGEVREAAQVASAVLTTLDEGEQLSSRDKGEVRFDLVHYPALIRRL